MHNTMHLKCPRAGKVKARLADPFRTSGEGRRQRKHRHRQPGSEPSAVSAPAWKIWKLV